MAAGKGDWKALVKKKHWLTMESIIVVLIIILLLNMIRVPVPTTETYTEQEEVSGTVTAAQAPYNETTCTKRDYRFRITAEGVTPIRGGGAYFDYLVANRESTQGKFRYKLGLAPIGIANIAKQNKQPIPFSSYTAESSVDIPPNSAKRVSVKGEWKSVSTTYYGELFVYPPQREECTTVEKFKEVEVPVPGGSREIQKSREGTQYISLWQKLFGGAQPQPAA